MVRAVCSLMTRRMAVLGNSRIVFPAEPSMDSTIRGLTSSPPLAMTEAMQAICSVVTERPWPKEIAAAVKSSQR